MAWRRLLACLDTVDQIVVSSAADIPGKTIGDLLKILATLRDHGVALYLNAEDIDTGNGGFVLLELIAAFRRAKLSHAIRIGQARAVAAGKRSGRPSVPSRVRERIQAALADGGGIRSTARRYGVSPGSVINIRGTMVATQCTF
jgi:DNA invertase Pin-like site-specific DNA recombinase